MTSQVQGLNQAVRNANDGAALIQTAEGGLEETTNILQRMRELSIQSANGTYDTGNRDTLNAEVKQLKLEIDRISETTSFNGLNVLDGSLGEVDLQVGENANQTIGLNIEASNTKSLGAGSGADIVGAEGTSGSAFDGLIAAGAAAGDLIINGVSVDALAAAATLEKALDIVNANVSNVNASTVISENATTEGTGVINSATAAGGVTFTITHADESTTAINITQSVGLDDLVNQINEKGEGAVQAGLTEDGYLEITSKGDKDIVISGTLGTDAVLGTGLGAATLNSKLTLEAINGADTVTVDYATDVDALELGIDRRLVAGQVVGNVNAAEASFNQGDFVLNGVELGAYDTTVDYSGDATAGDNGDLVAFINQHSDQTGVTASLDISGTGEQLMLQSDDGSEISVKYKDGQEAAMLAITQIQETNSSSGSGDNVASIDISTAAGAQKSIAILDEAIKEVSSIRGDLGAISNRLDYTTRNLSNISENAASARSQIMDADFAAESANLSRAQVLQQAGNAMLAQANSRPQQVLSLLQ
jgi:flagellin